MQLYDYQETAVSSILSDWSEYRSLLLVAATGSGKTVMFCEALRRVMKPGQRTIIMAQLDELIEQAHKTLTSPEMFGNWDIFVGKVIGDKNECDAQIVIGTYQTLKNSKRLQEVLQHGPIDYFVTDEAHHATAKSYRKIEDALLVANPAMKHLGVTATPLRSDNKGLGGVYEKVTVRITIEDMIQQERLVIPRWLGIYTEHDISNVRKSGDDFNAFDLAKHYDTPVAHEIVLRAYKEHAPHRSAVAFCASVDGAKRLCGLFNENGIPAAVIDQSVTGEQREAVLTAFRNGNVKVLCNFMVLTEGFDAPNADCILMARPTRSDMMYVQCMGRGMRTHEGKTDCLILDFLPKDTRNIKMMGDALRMPEGVKQRVLSVERRELNAGDVVVDMTFDGSMFSSTMIDVQAVELDYLRTGSLSWWIEYAEKHYAQYGYDKTHDHLSKIGMRKQIGVKPHELIRMFASRKLRVVDYQSDKAKKIIQYMLSQGEYQNKILEELLLKVGGSYGKWIGILHDMGVAANASISMSRVKENVKNKHGYLGVCKKNGKSKMYKCWISVNGKSIQRYGFSNAEDAARERDKLTLLYRDDKARLNFPELIEQYRAELAQEENT